MNLKNQNQEDEKLLNRQYALISGTLGIFFVMAEREGFEPSVPLLAAHTISSRAPSASSDISPVLVS